MKKKLLVGAAAGTAGLVALTGATFAQTADEDGTTGSEMWDRVAEILGVEPDDLEDAVQQARSEERDAKLAERLAEAVEEGVITQEEADAITAWFEARPAFLDDLNGDGLGKPRHRGIGLGLKLSGDSDRYEALIERLVEDAVITEDEAQELRDWIAARPTEALEKLLPEVGIGMGGGPGRGFHGHMFGRGPGGRLFEGRFHIMPYTPPADDGADSGAEPSGTTTGTSTAAGTSA